MLVLLQNIEHFDLNSAKNQNSYWQAKRKIKKFCPKFLIFFKFGTLEGTVVVAPQLYIYAEKSSIYVK